MVLEWPSTSPESRWDLNFKREVQEVQKLSNVAELKQFLHYDVKDWSPVIRRICLQLLLLKVTQTDVTLTFSVGWYRWCITVLCITSSLILHFVWGSKVRQICKNIKSTVCEMKVCVCVHFKPFILTSSWQKICMSYCLMLIINKNIIENTQRFILLSQCAKCINVNETHGLTSV